MSYTIEQYNALLAAISTGHLEVKYADKSIKYQNADQMRITLREMEAALILSGALNRARGPSTSVASFSRQ